MKKVVLGIAAVVALFTVVAFVFLVQGELSARNVAVTQLINSRTASLHSSAYQFATRGLTYGLTYEEVVRVLIDGRPSGLSKTEGSPEPYWAMAFFAYEGSPFLPLSGWKKIYISEQYRLIFDADRKLERIEYRYFDRGAHDITIDLHNKTMSPTLPNAAWQMP